MLEHGRNWLEKQTSARKNSQEEKPSELKELTPRPTRDSGDYVEYAPSIIKSEPPGYHSRGKITKVPADTMYPHLSTQTLESQHPLFRFTLPPDHRAPSAPAVSRTISLKAPSDYDIPRPSRVATPLPSQFSKTINESKLSKGGLEPLILNKSNLQIEESWDIP